MFKSCSNSQLLRRVLWISTEQTIGASLKHKNTQPLYMFNRVRVFQLHSFDFLYHLSKDWYFLRFFLAPPAIFGPWRYNSSTLFTRLNLRLGFKPLGPGFKILIKTGSKLFTQSHWNSQHTFLCALDRHRWYRLLFSQIFVNNYYLRN